VADSFDAVEEHERKRKALAQQVKEARAEVKAERQNLKSHASSVNDAASWTAKVLEGDARFASSSDHTEQQLAQATYGLKTAAEFRDTRARLEEEERLAAIAEANEAERRRVEAMEEKRERKKRKRQEQASKLSFELDDDG